MGGSDPGVAFVRSPIKQERAREKARFVARTPALRVAGLYQLW
jgi:hypothetical protein